MDPDRLRAKLHRLRVKLVANPSSI
jgi:hypothetical protein